MMNQRITSLACDDLHSAAATARANRSLCVGSRSFALSCDDATPRQVIPRQRNSALNSINPARHTMNTIQLIPSNGRLQPFPPMPDPTLAPTPRHLGDCRSEKEIQSSSHGTKSLSCASVIALLLSLMVLFGTQTMRAAEHVWSGASGNKLFSNPANWSSGGVPRDWEDPM